MELATEKLGYILFVRQNVGQYLFKPNRTADESRGLFFEAEDLLLLEIHCVQGNSK